MLWIDRLAAAGMELPPAPSPAGAYVPAVRTGNLVFTSGQLPMQAGTLLATGKLGAEVTVEAGREAARQCILNALAAAAATAGAEKITGVLKVTGFVASAPDFTAQPKVIDGASEVLQQLFPAGHARSAVGVAALPLDAAVEIEVIFTLAD